MASQIRFEPSGVGGMVASGTTVAAAAERLGIAIELCCGGKGECTSCAVRAVHEPFSLSPMTDAEHRMLSEADVIAGIRLGCLARTGESDCTIHVLDAAERPPMPETAESEASSAAGGSAGETAEHDEPQGEAQPGKGEFDEVRKRILDAFGELPAGERMATALELNMKAATDFFGTLFGGPLKAGEKALENLMKQAAEVVRDVKQKEAGSTDSKEPQGAPEPPKDDQETDRP